MSIRHFWIRLSSVFKSHPIIPFVFVPTPGALLKADIPFLWKGVLFTGLVLNLRGTLMVIPTGSSNHPGGGGASILKVKFCCSL